MTPFFSIASSLPAHAVEAHSSPANPSSSHALRFTRCCSRQGPAALLFFDLRILAWGAELPAPFVVFAEPVIAARLPVGRLRFDTCLPAFEAAVDCALLRRDLAVERRFRSIPLHCRALRGLVERLEHEVAKFLHLVALESGYRCLF